MHQNTLCQGCKSQEATTQHILECSEIIGRNEIITYIPRYQDLYGEDEDEQVYLARIITDNLSRMPE